MLNAAYISLKWKKLATNDNLVLTTLLDSDIYNSDNNSLFIIWGMAKINNYGIHLPETKNQWKKIEAKINTKIILLKEVFFYLDKNNISGNNLVKNYYSLTFMLISYLRFNKIILLQKYNCFHWPWKKLGKEKCYLKNF